MEVKSEREGVSRAVGFGITRGRGITAVDKMTGDKGLHGESFLAANLNIFFELRLASSTKPVPTAFAQWDVKKNTRQRKEKKRIRLQKGAKLIGVY